jgi:hypothetical protein
MAAERSEMAEYYAVLSKAVAGLEASSPDARRTVYDKARNALIGQLKAIDPPLPTQEISRQRLELEEAIRRVERETSAAPSSAPARTAVARTPQQAAPPPTRAEQANPPPTARQSSSPSAARQSPQDVFRRAIQEAEREAQSPRVDRAPVAARADASWGNERADQVPLARPTQSYLPSQGYVEEEPPQDEPRLAPDYDHEWNADAEPEATSSPARRSPAAYADEDDRVRPAKGKRGRVIAAHPRDDHEEMQQEARPSRLPAIILVVLILAMVGGLGALAWSQRTVISDLIASFDSGSRTTAPVATAPAAPAATDTGKDTGRLLAGNNAPATTAAPPSDDVRVVTPAPTPDATTGAGTSAAGDTTGTQTAKVEPPAATTPDTSASDTATTSSGDDSLVAQHATLYEEPLDSATAASGVVAINAAVTWSFEPKGIDGPEVVAHIDVPERGLKIKMTLRRNTDQTLPASHVVEVVVDAPASFPGKGIRDVPRLVMKPGEDARGQPLIGASAKVADGFFWIALSGVEADITANLGLMKDREWIDLPLVYENGQRAILTFEKGNPGDRVFDKALTAWAG